MPVYIMYIYIYVYIYILGVLGWSHRKRSAPRKDCVAQRVVSFSERARARTCARTNEGTSDTYPRTNERTNKRSSEGTHARMRQSDRQATRNRHKIDPRSLRNRHQIVPKSTKNRSGSLRSHLGRFGAPRGHSRDAPNTPRGAPGTLPGRAWGVPGRSGTLPERPGTLPRRVGQRSERFFCDVLARTRVHTDFRRIFRHFCVARGSTDMRFDCAGVIETHVAPFALRECARSGNGRKTEENHSKIAPKIAPATRSSAPAAPERAKVHAV